MAVLCRKTLQGGAMKCSYLDMMEKGRESRLNPVWKLSEFRCLIHLKAISKSSFKEECLDLVIHYWLLSASSFDMS